MDAPRVSLLDRLRSVLGPRRSLAERQQAGDYVPPRHLVLAHCRERERFYDSRPWRWLPRSRIPEACFVLFGASDELLRTFEADRRRWMEAREGRRPYWTEGARLQPRDEDPQRVALLLEGLNRRERPGQGRSSIVRRHDGPHPAGRVEEAT